MRRDEGWRGKGGVKLGIDGTKTTGLRHHHTMVQPIQKVLQLKYM
jgi:hypothetical protein